MNLIEKDNVNLNPITEDLLSNLVSENHVTLNYNSTGDHFQYEIRRSSNRFDAKFMFMKDVLIIGAIQYLVGVESNDTVNGYVNFKEVNKNNYSFCYKISVSKEKIAEELLLNPKYSDLSKRDIMSVCYNLNTIQKAKGEYSFSIKEESLIGNKIELLTDIAILVDKHMVDFFNRTYEEGQKYSDYSHFGSDDLVRGRR